MRLVRLDQLDTRPGDAVFRQSFWPPFLLSLLGIPMVVFGIAMLSQRRPGCIDWAFGVCSIVSGLLWAKIYSDSWRAARRETNWLLRVSRSGQIAVKYRTYLNWKFPADEPQVIVMNPDDVLCVRRYDRRLVTKSDDGTMSERRVDLEIVLRHSLSAEIQSALVAERNYPGVGKRFAKSRYKHECVQAFDESVLRLAWRSSRDQIRPKIDVAIEALRRFVAVGPPAKGEDDYSPAALAKLPTAEQDERLRQLAIMDRTLATQTIKMLYNCSTEEAVAQVNRWRLQSPAKGRATGIEPA